VVGGRVATKDTVMTQKEGGMHFSHILCACDLSAESFAALETFAKRDLDTSDKISVLSIIPEWMPPGLPIDSIGNVEALQQYRNETVTRAKASLEEFCNRVFEGGRASAFVIPSSGGAASEIIDFAERHGCNLIVMASHGAGALSNLFIGSTVQRVIRLASCPVLVIPKPR
jgi:nucleotide-binding universal stress UspA family protein